MAEGGLGRAPVFIRLAEREIEADRVLHRHAGHRQTGFHRGNVGIVEANGLEVGEAPPRRAFAGILAGDRAIGFDRVRVAAERALGVTDAQAVTDDVGRCGGVELLEDRQFLVEPTECAQSLGTKRLDRFLARQRGRDRVNLGEREGRALRLVEQFGQRHPGRRLVGRFGDRAAQQWLGKFKVARIGGLEPEHGQREDVAFIIADQSVEQRLGAGAVARLERLRGGTVLGVAHRCIERLMLGNGGLGELALAAERCAEQAKRGGIVRLAPEQIACLRFGRRRIGREQLPRLGQRRCGIGNDRPLQGSRSGRARHSSPSA